jgi:hypothetical protein
VGDRVDVGWARMRAMHLALPDFHDFFSAIAPHPAKQPGHVTFDVRWNPRGRKRHIRDTAFGFAGDYFACEARIDFAVKDDHSPVIYRSEPSGQTTVGAGVGRHRNGVFF